MRVPILATAASLLLALAMPAAFASPVTWSEAVNGDLTSPNNGTGPLTSLVFDVGTNTVSGTSHLKVGYPGQPTFNADFDSFSFTVPVGTTLANLWIQWTLTPDNAAKAEFDFGVCGGGNCSVSPFIGGVQLLQLIGATSSAFTLGGNVPLGAGTYTLFNGGLGISPLSTALPEGWSVDYTWSFRVVPEPGTLALLALAMSGIALARRRARNLAAAA